MDLVCCLCELKEDGCIINYMRGYDYKYIYKVWYSKEISRV